MKLLVLISSEVNFIVAVAHWKKSQVFCCKLSLAFVLQHSPPPKSLKLHIRRILKLLLKNGNLTRRYISTERKEINAVLSPLATAVVDMLLTGRAGSF